MDANVKRAALEWLKKKHAETKAAIDAPARQGESPREADARKFAEAESRLELAIIDALYNEIAGLP